MSPDTSTPFWKIVYINTNFYVSLLSQIKCFPPFSSNTKEEMVRSHSGFLVSSSTSTRSKRLSRGLARATLTDSGSLGLYWPLGLVAARMVLRVFSLHTILMRPDRGIGWVSSQC